MSNTYSEENRINVADGLRGFAIIAITLLHSINHFNLSIFPVNSIPAFQYSDLIINTVITYISSGKSYGVFALLFGFTFYLQLKNQEKRGNDFGYRFIWRMFILFIIGTINSAFFSGEILVLYSIVGVILVPLRHSKNRNLIILSVIFLLQPIILAKIIYILIDQNYIQHFERYLPDKLFRELEYNSFFGMIKTNLTLGKEIYWISILSNCERIFQSATFFIVGLLFGREKLFENSPKTNKFWKKALIMSLIVYIFLRALRIEIVVVIQARALQNMIVNILSLWSDFSAVIFIVGLFMNIYSCKLKNGMKWIEPFGKMSLTNYIMQSILGSFIFYGYGLSLSKQCGITLSFIIGITMLVLQYYFCIWWLKHHKKGPIEQLWHNLTWIKSKRLN
jgi:uncharacterized protein